MGSTSGPARKDPGGSNGATAPSDPSLLTRVMRMVKSGAALGEVLDLLATGIEAERPDMLASILLLDEAGQTLRHGAGPRLSARYVAAIDGAPVGPNTGSCGTAAHLGRRVIVTDIQRDPLWADYRAAAEAEGLAACWSEPIRASDGRVIGTFALYSRARARPSEADIAVIEDAAHLAAFAIERKLVLDTVAASEAEAAKAQRLQQATARELETFFAVSSDLLFICDDQSVILKVNQAWTDTLGYPIADVQGHSIRDLLPVEDWTRVRDAGRESRRSGAPVVMETRILCADGGFKHVEWRVSRVGDRSFGQGREVTARVEARAAMSEARALAEEANRAKSEFLANMSHEVRTPLNGVIGLLDALADTGLTSEQADIVNLMRASGESLVRLVSDILDISKIEAGRLELDPQPFNLWTTLRPSLDHARSQAEGKGLTFSVAVGEDARGDFVGDSVRLRQIIDNLLANAIKFTASGAVSIGIALEPAARTDAPETLVVQVEDSGVGFGEENPERLFERFAQGDATITRRFGGSGLGLAIVKAIVDLMGGAIEARPAAGGGAAFVVRLPAPRAPDAAAAFDRDVAGDPGAAIRPGLRVLLAEDNPINQKVVELILGALGAAVTTVSDGRAAIEAFKASAFDLVLMDMQMPMMDGLAATRAIRAYETGTPGRARTPVAMLSANAMVRHRVSAREAGADVHIAKPVTALALLEGIGQAFRTCAGSAGTRGRRRHERSRAQA